MSAHKMNVVRIVHVQSETCQLDILPSYTTYKTQIISNIIQESLVIIYPGNYIKTCISLETEKY